MVNTCELCGGIGHSSESCEYLPGDYGHAASSSGSRGITDGSSLAELADSSSGARGKKTGTKHSPVSTPQRTKWRNVTSSVFGGENLLNLGNIPSFPGVASTPVSQTISGSQALNSFAVAMPVPESQDSAFSFGDATSQAVHNALAQGSQQAVSSSQNTESTNTAIVPEVPQFALQASQDSQLAGQAHQALQRRLHPPLLALRPFHCNVQCQAVGMEDGEGSAV